MLYYYCFTSFLFAPSRFAYREALGDIRRKLCIAGFLILSAYGIAKSELNKPIVDVKVYLGKRILKLLKPFWLVNLMTIILYYIIGGGSPAEMLEGRINPAFSDIGSHKLSIADFFLMLIGVHEIDGAMCSCG